MNTKNITLSVPSPCKEKWSGFTPVKEGGFCSSCQKVVVDFTKMSDAELLAYLQRNQRNTCGRFRPDQLTSYPASSRDVVRPGFMALRAGLVSLFLLLLSKETSAQVKTPVQTEQRVVSENASDAASTGIIVRGVVRDKTDRLPLPAVNVVLKGSTVGIITDANGMFEFPQPLQAGDVLLFSFIGYKTNEFVIRKGSIHDSEMILELEMEMYLDMDILGELQVKGYYQEKPSVLTRFWNGVRRLF